MPTESTELTSAEIENTPVDVQTVKYLTFFSDNLLFGVNAAYVVEIITNHTLTTLPMTPDYVRGIINLRGQIIPIIDVRLRLGRMPAQSDAAICIIVLSIDSSQIGILVDRVSQMVDIDESAISTSSSNSGQQLVGGMISLEDSGETMLSFDCAQLFDEI